MNRRLQFAVALCAVCVAPAFAQEGTATLPPIQITRYVADCTRPALPSQRQVGEWADLHNFGQVYAARERLMVEIGQACRRPGVARVQVVMQQTPTRDEPAFAAISLQDR